MTPKRGFAFALLSLGLLAGPQRAMADENDHGKSAEDDAAKGAEEPTVPVASAGYKGGFFISDGGANKLVIQGRVQARAEHTSIDERGGPRGKKSAFSLPRVRLTLKGNAYTKRLAYKFQTDFGKGQASLKDFYLDYRVGEGDVRLRVGQFKMTLGRQGLNSSSKLEFVDRSIVNKYMGNGRDIGIGLHNNAQKSPETEWAVGVFNGSGAKGAFHSKINVDATTGEASVVGGNFSNVPSRIRPAVAMRVGRNSKGLKGYSEADIEGGDFRWGVAAAALTHFRYGSDSASSRVGLDFVAKQHGLSATGAMYVSLEGPKVAKLKYNAIGVFGQIGYMIDAKKQVAVRYATISKQGGDNQQEASAVFSIYEFAHGLKWQSDISYLHYDNGTKTNDVRGRSQVQLSF